MLQRILVSLLTYLMAFYPILGSLANAGSNKSEARSLPLQAVSRGQELGVEKQTAVGESTKVKLQETYGKLPLSFIQNNGQVDERVKFYEKGSGHATFFTKEGVYLSLVKESKSQSASGGVIESEGQRKLPLPNGEKERITDNIDSALVKLTPIGANKNPEILAQDKQEGKANYFIGNDPNKWKTNIPTHGAVIYKGIYKNIDMKFYGNNKQMEYDIIVKPGADPNMVKLSYEGIEGLKVTKEGDLLISLKEGSIIQKKPYIYQDINGKRVEVDGRFEILNSEDVIDIAPQLETRNSQHVYGFQIASYNKNHSLIIDPVLAYSTYLGGNGEDSGQGIAVDASGNVYITGWTNSTIFPTVNPIQGSFGGWWDVFVTKLNSSGTALVYSTYLGGSDADFSYGITVDASGNAYVTGYTIGPNFPTVNPIQGSFAGGGDAFVTKLNASGTALIYSTYLGGSSSEIGYGIAVDTSGNAYVTGYTESTNFPTVNPIQGSNAGGGDAFVTKLNASGTALVYSTYLGGSGYGNDNGQGIAVDALGNAYVTGMTNSTDFPTVNPIQGGMAGLSTAFVTKINSSGTALVYSTYLGGNYHDYGYRIAVDISGNAYVTGGTGSGNFPTVNPIQGSNAGSFDAFITKINPSGSAFVYSTYLGGNSDEMGYGIAVDTSGNAYIIGYTYSTNFPLVNPIQGSNAGQYDAFITKINPSGSAFVYATYLGGNSEDRGYGIAVDISGNAYVTGLTTSTDFPTVNPVYGSLARSWDAFVAKISSAVSGCIQLNGSAVSNASVTLKQRRVTDQITATNSSGCYYFDKAVSGKSFQVIIDGPLVP